MTGFPHPHTADAAVVGAGPIGCVAALALARAGAQVLLLEANPAASKRLAGEWLHPPGLAVLRRLGLDVAGEPGRGFAVFPEGHGEPVLLPYAAGEGLSCEHEALVDVLRRAAAQHPGVSLLPSARVLELDGDRLTFVRPGESPAQAVVERIVGADGRSSAVRRAAGLAAGGAVVSATAGVVLEDVDLPVEGFGHVLLGGPGPVLVYRLGPGRLRACLDLPDGTPRPRDAARALWESYGHAFPGELVHAFAHALRSGRIAWAANRFRSRARAADLGVGSLLLAGDAAGHFHPLTAVGMTLGLADAERIPWTEPDAYRRERARASRVPELLATTLYAAFTRQDGGTAALRRAMLELWRDPRDRARTMRLLSTEETRTAAFYGSFLKVLALTVDGLAEDALRRGHTGGLDGFGWWLRRLTVGPLRHQPT